MKKLFVFLCLAFSTTVMAGTQTGTVVYVTVRSSDGLIIFVLNGYMSSAPACATHGYWIIRDENSNAGKQQYAMLLAAQAAGKVVRADGRNTCVRWSDGEDVDTIKFSD